MHGTLLEKRRQAFPSIKYIVAKKLCGVRRKESYLSSTKSGSLDATYIWFPFKFHTSLSEISYFEVGICIQNIYEFSHMEYAVPMYGV